MTGTVILALDPGPELTGWLLLRDQVPVDWGKGSNLEVLDIVSAHGSQAELAIEMVASYGMPVGAEVFETCVWAGRFIERWIASGGREPRRVYRREVKLHLCGTSRAKDTNVRQALIDRYGPGKSTAIGLKATPGPLYGITGDVWQALAVAITAADTHMAAQPITAAAGAR